MDYTPLEKLSASLNERISALKSGKMNPEELSGLVASAREVYERLVVLEYQAFEKSKLAHAELEATPFKIDTSSEPDEALSEPEPVEEKPKEEEEPEITNDVVVSQKEPTVEEPIKIDSVKAPEAPEVKEEEGSEPLSEKTKQAEPEAASIAEKFEQAPIEDIAKSISLNEKFQFIRVLCHNNAKNFETLLERVNNSTHEEEALKTFATLIPLPENDDDLQVYEKFQELIKRRF